MSEVNTDPSVIKMDEAARAVDACRLPGQDNLPQNVEPLDETTRAVDA